MKFKRNFFAFDFANFDDWNTSLSKVLRESIEKTKSPLVCQKLQDALLALQEHDECLITVTEICEIPDGITGEYLMQKLQDTFDENELELVKGSIKVTVSLRGTFERVHDYVHRTLNSEVRRAVVDVNNGSLMKLQHI